MKLSSKDIKEIVTQSEMVLKEEIATQEQLKRAMKQCLVNKKSAEAIIRSLK